ncbi:hypothetical protein CFIMG_007970RA00001 [Ceratocystis fimbriata CBS 114723]|uniref:Heterokaryon incompatibility domain-containing protein n=1 Tax=Ceratocystis fimbriata CBS 114723 TaxID=1035309 RepID=A0A2C5WTN5_9PEZI|nr:hypothetical protein CFIMG_007970RA00001 [Ceratocystis fimbriata CBS 114723]
MAPRSISSASTLSRSSLSPLPEAPPSHAPGKIPEPDISDESESDTQSQIRHSGHPPPPPAQPPLHLSDSDVEDARSAVRVSQKPSSRRASGQGSVHTVNHDNRRTPSVAPSATASAPPPSPSPSPPPPVPAPPPPDDATASKAAQSMHSDPSLVEPNPPDAEPQDEARPGPPPPPSPPSPSASIIKPLQQPPAAPQSDVDPSEAEIRASKERRARKARARSQTQSHRPPSPPPEPVDGGDYGGHRSDRDERRRLERQRDREREKEIELLREARDKPRRERRGSVRERNDRERDKERDRADREKERHRGEILEDRDRAMEEDRIKDRQHRRERRNSIRTRDKDREKERTRDYRDLEREEDEERSKERYRRERRGSMRARDKDREAVRAMNRERERERERDREREVHGHRRHRTGTRYHDVSDRDEIPVDHRRYPARDKDRDREPDVRFSGAGAAGLAHREKDRDPDRRMSHRDREKQCEKSDESDYDRDRERAIPPQIHAVQPPRTSATRPRRNSQTQPGVSPQRRQSLTERIRNQWHGLRRDSSMRKSNRNKSPPMTSGGNTAAAAAAAVVGATTAAAVASRPESPARAMSRPVSSSGLATAFPTMAPAQSQMGAPSAIAAESGPGVIGAGAAAAAAALVANNPRTDPVGRLRAWLEQCDIKHGVHCSGTPPGMAPAPWRPEYVIDCVEFRLVNPQAEDKYVALSYVWGEQEHSILEANKFMTMSSNLDEFCESLESAEMSPAFLDAIWLVQKMDVRYLWIDKFCIVQDDEAMKDEHVRNMPFLYANATFTIVVALDDVTQGLVPLDRKRVAQDSKALHMDLVLDSTWSIRAWTLQEALYSRRRVYIFQDVYSWECHCDAWQSNILVPAASGNTATTSTKHKILGGSGITTRAKAAAASALKCTARVAPAALCFRHTQWPDMDEFACIVMDYSTRRLTYVQDTQRAFSGITNLLSRTFAGGFVFGMPVMFLDAAMLWKPQASIRRRVLPPASTGPTTSGAPSSTGPIPSWSWMGWFFDDVPIDTTIWRAAADYVESTPLPKNRHPGRRYVSQFHFRLRSLVSYTLTDTAATSGQTATPLLSTGLDRRGQRLRKDTDLPIGWSFTRDNYLRHESDPATRFRYSIPVAPAVGGLDSLAGAAVQPPGSLLSFRAERAFLHVQLGSIQPMSRNGVGVFGVGATANKLLSNPPVAIGQLVLRNGRYAGTVTAHDAWLGIQSSNYDLDVVSGEKLELVAVSVSSERGGSAIFPPDVFREFARSDTLTLEFVNVLWIEWVGGIAYRRGLGHVLLAVWDGLQRKDEIDVLLG